MRWPPARRLLGFVACGAVLRRRALLEVGGFPGAQGFGGEERAVALDLAAAGWDLAYDPAMVAHHHPRPSGRRAGRARRAVRNDLWTAWSRLRWRFAFPLTLDALRHDHFALAAALRRLPRALRERRPVPPLVADALRAIDHHERKRIERVVSPVEIDTPRGSAPRTRAAMHYERVGSNRAACGRTRRRGRGRSRAG